jgi:lipoprotein NlpD
MKAVFCALLALAVAGCASRHPVPVADSRDPTWIEAAKPAAPAAPAAAPTVRLHTVKKGDTLQSIALEQGVDYRELAAWNNIENPDRIRVGQQLRLAPPAAPAMAADGAAGSAGPGGADVRPVTGSGGVVARPLDGAPAVAPPPTFSDANTEQVKRGPKGGKLPYSPENLALLKAREAAPQAVAPAPVVPTVVPPPAAATDAGGLAWAWPAPGQILMNFNESGAGQELNKGIDIAGNIGDPVQAAAAGKVIYVGVFPKHGNLVVVLHADGYSSVYAHNSRILVKEGQAVSRGQKIAEIGNSDADQPKLHFEVRQQGKPVDPLKFLPPR